MFLKNTNQNSKTHEYLFRKFMYCQECGKTISINEYKWKKQGEEVVKHTCYCNRYKKYLKYDVCTPHKFDYDEFEKIIITDIIEQYPEYKQKLQSQFEKIVVGSREDYERVQANRRNVIDFSEAE